MSSPGISLQPRSIPRRFRRLFCAAALLAAIATPHLGARADGPAAGRWREDPAYVRLFAPPGHRDAYRAFVTPEGLDAVLRLLSGDATLLQTPGSWAPRQQSPTDAFGEGGPYDRRQIARLYGSRRATVARGPHASDGRVDEMWTLVSPYPSPSFDRLEPGTLLLVLRVP